MNEKDCFNLLMLLLVQHLYYFEISKLNIIKFNHKVELSNKSDNDYTIYIILTNEQLNIPDHCDILNKTIKLIVPIDQYIKDNDLISFDYQLIYKNLLDDSFYFKDLIILVYFELPS